MDYGNYLKIPQLLQLQEAESLKRTGEMAHDEMLFIITHQTYELWFKQILFEIHSVKKLLSQDYLHGRELSSVVEKTTRVNTILKTLVKQIDIMETMTATSFLEFRHHLVPASGFQSLQFRQIEAHLGLKYQQRMPIEQVFLKQRLTSEDLRIIQQLDQQASLLSLVDQWLARFPLKDEQDYWHQYQAAVVHMLGQEEQLILKNHPADSAEMHFEQRNLASTKQHFSSLFSEEKYQEVKERGEYQISRQAMLCALFVYLNKDFPILALPYQFLQSLVEIDEQLTLWRQRHALMVQRILGNKVGTGGSSGHHYLSQTVVKNRIFADFFNLTSFLIPKKQLPELSHHIKEMLDLNLTKK